MDISSFFRKTERLFYFILFCFIFYILILILYTQSLHLSFTKIILILITGLLYILIIYYLKKKNIQTIKYSQGLVILILIALIIKICNIVLVSRSIEQISDFSVYLRNAVSESKSFTHTVHFYHWAMISKIYGLLTPIFGKTQPGAIIFMSSISIINIMLVYFLAFLITNKSKFALISGLIYALWPTNILYVNIFSNEHLAILFLLVCISIFIIFHNHYQKREIIWNYLFMITLGMCLSILKFIKPIAPIAIIAIILFSIYNLLISENKLKLKNNIIMYLLVAILFFFITNMFIFKYLDNLVGQKVNRNPEMFYLYMGLSPNNPHQGSYSNNVVDKYNKYYSKYNGDFVKIRYQLANDLKTEISSSYYKLPRLFITKYSNTWNNDLAALHWVEESIKYPNQLLIEKEKLIDIGSVLSQVYYVIIILLYIFGIIYCFYNDRRNIYLLLINLIVFGFILLLLISETQGRYKIITYPFIAIMATHGLDFINKKIEFGGKNEEIY